MGFTSGFAGGMVTGGLLGGLGLLENPGLMSFIASQLTGGAASSYYGLANDKTAETLKYMEEAMQRNEELIEQVE